MSVRARRRFEFLEARLAPSDTLLVIGAAAMVASPPETPLIAPPKYAEQKHWTPEKMEVRSIIPPQASSRISTRPPEAIDNLFRDELDLHEPLELGESLGPDFEPAEPTSPRPAAPTPLATGAGPGSAPGGAAAPGGGGGGGGGGGSGGGGHANCLFRRICG